MFYRFLVHIFICLFSPARGDGGNARSETLGIRFLLSECFQLSLAIKPRLSSSNSLFEMELDPLVIIATQELEV